MGRFARHPTAGNLLMLLMIMFGVLALISINRQFFPDLGLDLIRVQVEWPGATAEDTESSIIEALEPELRFLDAVDKVTSNASEGSASIMIEFVPNADMQKALSDVESAVGQVTTLPDDSERPDITQIVRYDTITRIILSGPYTERALKRFAKQIREELLDLGVDRVSFYGSRDEEIRVEIEPQTLRRLDLTLDDVAEAIGRASQDVPAGALNSAFERQPRALGLARTGAEIAAIEVLATPSGRKLTVLDMAQVTDGFEREGAIGRRLGEQAIELHVQRALTNDALVVSDVVESYLRSLRNTMPPELLIETHDDAAQLIRDRIDLLLRNGFGGLVLVLGVLFLFLNARVAFWIAAGIPISLLGMLGFLWLNDLTINMISLFAMILAIGIVVDDAIVVGEHAMALREQGLPPLAAAEQGALHMVAPVTSASLTTIASFLPILMVGDIIGQVIRDIPLVVIAVLIASLIECFFVLPCHMRGALSHLGEPSRFRQRFNRGFAAFRDGPFRRLVALAVNWRYATLATAVGALVLSIGVIQGGQVGFVFFSAPEASVILTNVVMAPGTSRAITEATLGKVDQGLRDAESELGYALGELVEASLVQIGRGVVLDPRVSAARGDNIGAMRVQLVDSDQRDTRTPALIDVWRANLPLLPGVETLTITEQRGGPPGREVDIRLQGGESVDDLKHAALEVRALLARLPGVSQIDDDLAYGKQEVIVELTPRGRALGFTTESVGRQLRDAFEGRIAKRFARGDEEVEVVVSLTEAAEANLVLTEFPLRSPTGQEVLLSEIVTLREDRGYARIQREDGVRQVSVTAELDEALIHIEQVIAALSQGELSEIARSYGLSYRFAGKAEEQEQTLADIRLGAILGLMLIYIVLAWVFASFTRPFAVMLVIPFGLIGAVLGHMLLGYDLSILSLITLLGLSGILVNDSIILVTAIDGHRKDGVALERAILDGTCSRFRAVLLTSGTTIGGLTPLMFETSQQAQFLIPMAITIVFGLMVTTFLVLLLVPTMISVQADLGALTGRFGRRRAASA